jgi:hypothetical protein
MQGSLVNRLMEGPTKKVPEVGMGVTITHWSDRDPGTIVAVRNFKSGTRKGQPREIDIQHDDWKVISGSEGDGSAKYEYTPNTSGPVITYVVNLKGRWVRKGQGGKGSGLILDSRNRYCDPHF